MEAYLGACGVTDGSRRRAIIRRVGEMLAVLRTADPDIAASILLIRAIEAALEAESGPTRETVAGRARLALVGQKVWPAGRGPLPPPEPAVMPTQNLLLGRPWRERVMRLAHRFRRRSLAVRYAR